MVMMATRPTDVSLPRARSEERRDPYDAILIVGFGGPERRDDVLPFLENVTRGRNVPRERLLEVAEHYDHFGGVSPINSQVRDLIAALRPELDRHGISLPIYWGNRNWHPMLADTLSEMAVPRSEAGPRLRPRGLQLLLQLPPVPRRHRARASSRRTWRSQRSTRFASSTTTPTSSPPTPSAFARPSTASDRPSRERCTSRSPPTAFPMSMARNCQYEHQLTETCRLVAEEIGVAPERWALVYQSRSGRPGDPWLEPDILDHLRDLRHRGIETS